jgi:gamma-glutamyl:cysteine ligase YbdK (ATP-grasp superfamily)
MKIGIEHEFVFKNPNGDYLDFANTEYTLFQKIVDDFPCEKSDSQYFECKSLETQPKRCYIEGFERYDEEGKVVATIPKGLEIRTTPHSSCDELIAEFVSSYHYMENAAKKFGLSPLLVCWHPFKDTVVFNQPFNQTEQKIRTKEEAERASHSMLSSGMHFNVSVPSLTSMEQMQQLLYKINYYTPFIIPYSFSSPFSKSMIPCLSNRNYNLYLDRWPIAYIATRKNNIIIEFRGFDACGDAKLLKALILLFKALIAETALQGKALYPDKKLLTSSVCYGFDDPVIKKEGKALLNTLQEKIADEEAIILLRTILDNNNSYAKRMREIYTKTGDIIQTVSNQYRY